MIDSLKAIPTVSIAIPLDDLVGSEKGIYVNALQHGREWERAISLEMMFPRRHQGLSDQCRPSRAWWLHA